MVMFASIADSSDESRQIASLHELNMVLSMGSGSVKVGELTPMLVKQLNTSSNHEVVLLACRALNTIIDINPRACELILPAVGTLCEKLLNIDDIDVAEQSMKCLSLLAMDHARFVFDAGGLAATTLYFDFFPQHIQRMALSACVNLCECVGTKADVTRLLPVLPFLSKCLAMDDEHASQKACQCLCRIIDNFSPRKRLPVSASFHRFIMSPSSSGASHPAASSYSSSAAGGSSASASGAGGTGKPSEPGRSSSANSGGSSSTGSGTQGVESRGKKDSGGRATDGESGDGRAGASKSGDGQEKEQEPEYWRAGFFRRMAEEGLIYQWIRMLQESNGSTTYATKTQILTSLVTLLELAPGVLPLLYENEGVEVLHKLLAEYTDPGKAPKGGSFASPAFVTAILQLVKTMLPAPDAMAKASVARQVKESSTATPKTLKRLPHKEKPVELVSLDSDSAISLDAMSVGGDDDTVGTPKPSGSPAAACTETPASSASALAAAALVAEWSCPACTFINMGASKIACEVCGTMNPHRTIISSPSRPKRTVKDVESDLQEMDFDAESAGHMSIIDVYADEPLYYNMYADGLMAPLLKLALQTSSRAVTQHVFSVLASVHAHHLSSLSAPAVASDVSAVIMQNLIHDDSDSVSQSIDLARSLLSSTPGLYKEHFLRHGIMTQIALLYEARAARKPPSSQSGSSSSSSTSHRRHGSSTSRSRDAGKHKTSDKVLLAASKFFAALTPSAALEPPAEGATSGGAGGGGGKKRRRPTDEEGALQSSGPPAGMDLESKTLKCLRTLATTLLSLALSEEQKTKAVSLMGKRHRDGRGRAASAIEVSDHAMALEPMQSLAKLINDGVTIFELKESGILDALAAFLYSCVERGVGQKNEGEGDTAMVVDADRERALNTTVDRFTKLYAFASAFSRARSRPEAARKGDGATEDTRETVLEALVSALHATLNSIDALASVRHGGEALQSRYKTLIRPFRLRFREQLSLPTSASSDSASSSSSQPSHVSVNTAQVMCYSFLAEPLTTIAQVRRYIETQARNGVQRYREETRRAAAEAAAAAAKSKEKEKTETCVGASGGAVTQADVDQGASSSASRRSPAEQTNEATQTLSAKSSSASLKRPQSQLEVDTAVEADVGQDTKRPMLRRSPRVEKAQQQQGGGGGGLTQPEASLKEPRSTRSSGSSSAVSMSSSSSSTKPIASRTRSHEPRLEPGLEDSKSPRSSLSASAGASAAQASSSESAVVADKGKRAQGGKSGKKRGRSRAPTSSTDKSGSTSAAAEVPTLPPKHGGRRTRSTRSSSSTQREPAKPDASFSVAAAETASEGKCAAAGATSTTRPPSPKDIPDTEGGASPYPLRSRKGDSTDFMVGTKVYSCFNVRGQKLWYEGRVTASTNGTVDVLYEDGERRAGMPRVHVQLSIPQDAVLFKHARRSLGLPPKLGSGLLRDVPVEMLAGKSGADARSKSDKGSGRAAASSEGSVASGGAIRSSAPAASAGGSAADDRRLFGLMGDHDYSDEDDMAFSAFGTTGSRSSSSTISSKLPAKSEDNREGSSVSASASGNAASGSTSVAAAAAPRAPRPSYQRSVMYPTFILRRRFAGLDVVHDQEHAGLVLLQLGLSGGMSPYDRPLIDAYTVEEMPSSKEDTTTTFTRRMQNLKTIMENLGPAKVARKPSSVSTSAASLSSLSVKKTMRVTNVRLTLDDVSVSLVSLPETVTTFEVVQCLLWARAESRAKRGFLQPGAPGVPLTHRDMSIEERDWVEAVMIDFEFEAQCKDAGAPSVATSADGLKAAAAGSSCGSPSACATGEVVGAEGGVEGGKAAAAAVQRPAGMDVVEPRHPKLHTTLLPCGCTTLDASVQSRGSVDLAPLTDQRSATTDVKKRREWRETSVDSSIVRSVLRLLRMLRLVCRYMERATSSGSGEASAASEQDLATAVSTVDWRKVAADCTLRSLSRKLMAQLQDPVAVLSETWPEWCDRVAMDFAELVPLDVRMQYFHCTTFNHARSLHLLQEQAQRLQSGAAADSNASGAVVLSPLLPPMHRTVNLSDYVTRFGRLRRRKILLPRENMLEAAIAAINAAIEENASQSACAHAVHHDEDDDDAGEEDPVDEGAEEPEEQPEGIEEEGDVKPEAKAEGEEGRHGEEGVSTAEELEGGVKEESGASAGEGAKGGDEESHVEEDQAGEGQEEQQQEEHHGDDEHDDEEEEGGGGGAYVRTPGTFRDAILVVDFENETGHGTGPTQEFFSLICRELIRRGLGLWRDDASAMASEAMETDDDAYLDCGGGLFPAVLPAKDKQHADDMDKRLGKFRFMGRVIAKALQDNRLLDLPLSEALCKLLVGHPLTLADVSSVDQTLGRSLSEMQRMATNPQVSRAKLRDYVDSLHLDFTLPGAEWYELKEGGSKLQVTVDNVTEYVTLVAQHVLVDSVREPLEAIVAGVEDVFPINALKTFGPEELQRLLCGGHEEDWGAETIERSLICKHGYTRNSSHIQSLVRVMASFDKDQRKKFLMFITGTPRLPIGGFTALKPNLTVVRKDVPPGSAVDDYLPSCSTCQVYLKLPPYSAESVMRKKLHQAMTLGQNHFALD